MRGSPASTTCAAWARSASRTSTGSPCAGRRPSAFDPSLLYDAVARGDVDAISAFSSDGRIATEDLVVLEDPAGALPAYDAMILLGPRVAGDRRVACALGGLQITVERMRHANAMVDHDHASPRDAAAWLLAQPPPASATPADCSKLALP
jgi:glycine betaine/choline ABC-type transport system substrate-binding protein